MSKLPVSLKGTSIRLKDKAATRKVEFNRKIAALRKTTGKIDVRVIPYRCAVHGKQFFITLERASPAHKYRIVKIKKEQAKPTSGASGLRSLFGQKKPPAKSYNADEFDFSGRTCPWCQSSGASVHCSSCGETVCGGRIKSLPSGKETFACHDGCGATGTLVPCDYVHGSTDGRLPKIGKQPLLPNGRAVPRIGFRKQK